MKFTCYSNRTAPLEKRWPYNRAFFSAANYKKRYVDESKGRSYLKLALSDGVSPVYNEKEIQIHFYTSF